MTFADVIADPFSRAMNRATAMVRAVSNDRVDSTALTRLRTDAARPHALWLPPLVNGALPPGVHDVSVGAFLVQVGGTIRRDELLRPLAARLEALARHGVREVYVGGSMTTDILRPNDLDALIKLGDVRTLGMRGRLRDLARGINWHVASVRHTSSNPGWHGYRPSWFEYFQHDHQLQRRGIARVLLTPSGK